MTGAPRYDPMLYKGSAGYYLRGRPPYSRRLRETVAAECGLDGTGRLLDVGCGPGVLTVELAPLVEEAVGLDPDADMLAEAARHACEAGITHVRWVQAVAEQLPDLQLGPFSVVTFGQSFHRTERERVAESVYDLLQPGGSIVMVAPTVEGRPAPPGPDHPRIPQREVRSRIERYLGPRPRAGTGFAGPPMDRWEDALRRMRFGQCRQIFAVGPLLGLARGHRDRHRLQALRQRAPPDQVTIGPGSTHLVLGKRVAGATRLGRRDDHHFP